MKWHCLIQKNRLKYQIYCKKMFPKVLKKAAIVFISYLLQPTNHFLHRSIYHVWDIFHVYLLSSPPIYGRGLKYHFIPAHLNLRSLRNLKTSCLRFSSATTTPPLPQSFSAVIGRPVWFSANGRSWLAHMTAGLYCGQTGRQAVGLTNSLTAWPCFL